jgi:hypothetical protein
MSLISQSLFAQTGKIKGLVVDQMTNQPLPFVSVLIQNTNNGTITDTTGIFELTGIADEFVRIQLSSLGYEPLLSEVITVSRVKLVNVELRMSPVSKKLSEVKVMGATFIRKPESPLSLQTIGIDIIEKSAGSNRDISKVIQSFPGIGGYASERNDLIVRGGGPAENRFYLDGIEIPNLNHFATQGASGGPAGILNTDFIREVDFYSGSFPASRGNALSSVLEMKQIDGNTDATTIKASLGASEVSLSANTPLTKNTTLIASARRSYLQFLFSQLGLPFLPTFSDFQFKTKTKFNPKNELVILGVGAIDNTELNTSIEPTEKNQYILSYLPVYKQNNYTIGTIYKHFFQTNYLSLVGSRNYFNNQSFKYLNNIETPQNLNYNYYSTETENKFRAEFNARPGDATLNVGTGIEHAEYYNSTFSRYYDASGLNELNYLSRLSIIKWSLFGNASQTFNNQKLTISVGMRFDANNYSGQMNNLAEQFSPRVSVSYQLTNHWFFNANAGRYFQQPAYTTLGYSDNTNLLVNKANGIKFIRSDHKVAGFEFRPNDFVRFSVEAFWKNYHNYPFSVSDSVSLASKGGNYSTYGDEEVTPTSTGRARGFELLFRQRSPKGYSLVMAYTFVRSEFSDLRQNLIPSSWDNRHLITLTANKKLKRNWDAGIKWRFLGGLPYTPYDAERSSNVQAWDARGREYIDYGRFNELRLKPFHQLDVRVDKTWVRKNMSIGLYLDIQNFYNKKAEKPANLVQVKDEDGNPVILNPQSPINEQRYLLKELQTSSGTILPTIGVMIEF